MTYADFARLRLATASLALAVALLACVVLSLLIETARVRRAIAPRLIFVREMGDEKGAEAEAPAPQSDPEFPAED